MPPVSRRGRSGWIRRNSGDPRRQRITHTQPWIEEEEGTEGAAEAEGQKRGRAGAEERGKYGAGERGCRAKPGMGACTGLGKRGWGTPDGKGHAPKVPKRKVGWDR